MNSTDRLSTSIIDENDRSRCFSHSDELDSTVQIDVCMGGGAGPAGQVLAGPLFCLINYSQNERHFLGLNLFLRNHRHFFLSVSLSTRWQR